MSEIKYVKLDEVDPDDLMDLLNRPTIREHLIKHDYFDSETVLAWVKQKIDLDSQKGCRVRAIFSNNSLAGWCGIQLEEGKYEIAIVLSDKHWGIGINVLKDIMRWAGELGHKEVFIHFLHTRPEYKFLKKISKKVFMTELRGNKFTTYQLSVEECLAGEGRFYRLFRSKKSGLDPT